MFYHGQTWMGSFHKSAEHNVEPTPQVLSMSSLGYLRGPGSEYIPKASVLVLSTE
jgi:hypothetical protein